MKLTMCHQTFLPTHLILVLKTLGIYTYVACHVLNRECPIHMFNDQSIISAKMSVYLAYEGFVATCISKTLVTCDQTAGLAMTRLTFM